MTAPEDAILQNSAVRDRPPKDGTLIQLCDVGVAVDGRFLVRHVDFSIRRGEIVSLIGPNGSGKSTTAKTLLGLIAPTEGRVIAAPDLTVGYMPQTLAIDWTLPLTVRRLMKLTGGQSNRDIAAALARTGVDRFADTDVQSLSGGEFQRVLLARALIRKPDLLVLDEPVRGVDYTGEIALYELIRTIRNELGCGVLLISHDLHIVMAETDTVICLNGHVCCSGTPQSVAESREFHDLFGARAAETLAIYTHKHDHVHLADGSVHRHPDPERAADA